MKDDILILFGIEIECVSGNKYAIANRDDIKSDDVQNWLLNSFSVSNLLMEGQSLKDRLLLEDIPSGNKYLTQVIDAMRQNLTLQVEYQSFKMSAPRNFEIAPYCIKVFKQRWYIIGLREGNDEVHFYSLDRVLSMEITENAFNIPKSFNADAFLHNYYGVMAGTMPAESVLLRVTPFRANYLRSLPLHHSQKETERTDDYSVFEYWIAPTADFIQELRSFLPEITVLKPLWLRDKFIEEAKQVLKNYQ
jgi:predicted DNA-binding transcriptional regulator YafY